MQHQQLLLDFTEKYYHGFCQLDNTPRTIIINLDLDKALTQAGIATVKDQCLLEHEFSPQEGLARAACAFSDDSAHAQRIYDYASRQWLAFATPVLSNGGAKRGLPISCFINKVGDSREGLAAHYDENLWFSTSGGGCGSDWSSVRSNGTKTSKGNKTTGVIPFIKVSDSLTAASWQGSTRRGAAAVYLSVSHPEIEEFIEIRKPTGDANRRSHNLHNAVSIPDAFMLAVEQGSGWELRDPHTDEVVKVVDARTLWMSILSMRLSTGEPYLFFEDTANKALPDHLKNRGKCIHSSNLCTEIMLPTDKDTTAVCCLSSVNLEKFEEWKDETLFVEDLMRMLDNVLSVFIKEAPNAMWRAVKSAENERSVGLGALGFHAFLQSKGVAFESAIASSWNRKIFKHLKTHVDEANIKLGVERGSCPDYAGHTGYPKRFSHTQAIAPNATSSIVCGNASPSIEPYAANAFTLKTHSGVFLVKNKHLDKLFKDKYGLKDKELDNVWQSVILSEGSVQHLDFLNDQEKFVFKTAMEIDQTWVIEHASVRQEFIDQGQSVNLFVHPEINKGDMHNLHKLAWKKGLKSLYYCRSKAVKGTEKISYSMSNHGTECKSCEG